MKPVHIKRPANAGKKSRLQTRYEQLFAEIEKIQQFNIKLKSGLRKAQVKLSAEILPLEKERNVVMKHYLIRLDELSTQIGMNKPNREWFDGFMEEETNALLVFFGHQDKVLSDLFQKYAGLTFEDMLKDEQMKSSVEYLSEMLGFEVDAKELLEKGESAYFEEVIGKVRGKIDSAHKSDSTNEETSDIKQTPQDVNLVKDARSIYMRLVKKFHPDLETDPLIIDQYNEIIKKVTTAYQENDFFNLLKLQITYLEDNETDAVKVADDMLKRYNKLLQKQLNELTQQTQAAHFASGDIIDQYIDKNGNFSPQKFTARKKTVEKGIAEIVMSLADSKKRPKGWFKDQLKAIKDDMEEKMMANMFDDIFDDFDF